MGKYARHPVEAPSGAGDRAGRRSTDPPSLSSFALFALRVSFSETKVLMRRSRDAAREMLVSVSVLMSLAAAAIHPAPSSAPAPLRVVPCESWSGDNSSSGWKVDSAGGENFVVRNGGLCLVGSGDPFADRCDTGAVEQRWRNFSGGTAGAGWQLQSVADPAGRCLMVASTSYAEITVRLVSRRG